MANPKAGPVVMPWEQDHPEELAIIVLGGMLGACLGATLMYHFRKHQGRA